MKQNGRFRKKWILILIALIVISLGSIYALREVLIAPRLSVWLTHFIEAKLDLKVSIDRIRGTYFTGITVENLTTQRPSSVSPISDVSLKELTLNYSLLSLFGGFTNFLTTASIDVRKIDITLNLDHFSNYSGAKSDQPFHLPLGLPPVTVIPHMKIQNSSLTLLKNRHSSIFNDVDLTLEKDGPKQVRLNLTAADCRWHVDDVSQGSAPMAMALIYDEDGLLLEYLSVGEDSVRVSATMGLTELPQSVPFTLKSLIAGGALEVVGHLESDALVGQFRAEQLNVETLTASGIFPSIPVKGSLSFMGKGHFPFHRPQQVKGDIQLDLQDGHILGLSAENLHADVFVEKQSFHVRRLNLKSAENQLIFTEMMFPMSLFALSGTQKPWASFRGGFQLDLKDVPAVLDMVGQDIPYKALETPEHRLLLDGQIKNGGLVMARGDLSVADSRIQLKSTHFALPTDDGSFLNTSLDAQIEMHIKDLSLFGKIFPLPPLNGQLQGEMRILGSFADPRGSIEVEAKGLQYKDLPVSHLAAKINGDGQRINAEKLDIISMNDVFHLNGAYRIDSKTLEKVHVTFQVDQIQTYLHHWLGKTSPVQGDVEGSITASGPLLEPHGRLVISSRKSQLRGLTLLNTFIKGSVKGRQLDIEQAKTHTGEGLLSFAGLVQADEAFKIIQGRVTDFLMRWRGNDLRLMAPSQVKYFRPGTLDIKDLILGGSIGELRFNGRLSSKKDSNLSFQVSHLNSQGWLNKIINLDLDFDGLEANGTMQGTLNSPKVDLSGRVRSLRSEHLPSPLFGEFQIAYGKEGIQIEQFNWMGEGGLFIKATGLLPILYTNKINLLEHTLSLDAEARLPEIKLLNGTLKKELIDRGSAFLKLKMSGTWQKPIGNLTLKTTGMEFKIGSAPLPPGPSKMEANFQYEGGKIQINTLRLEAPSLLFTGQGVWRNCPTPEMLCSSSDHILSGEIVFEGNAAVSDLNWLASGVSGIRRIGGRLDAAFNVQGPLRKPKTSAKINLQEGELRLQMDFPTMKEIEVQAVATPDEIVIQKCSAQLGGETVHLQGKLDSIGTSRPFADVHVWGENLLLYRSQELRLRADTDLTLKGELQKLMLNGAVAITEGRFSQYIDVISMLQGGRVPQSSKGIRLFSIRKAPFKDMGLSVKISANKAFDIRNNFLRSELRPELLLKGTGEAPILTGTIVVDTARLRLPSGNLLIENGLVQFLETNPDRPVLNLVGNTRMLGYDISVIMEGPYDEPSITLTSSPPLTNEDLLMLVLTGTPPSSSGKPVDKRSRNLNVAVYVGRDLLARWFHNENGGSTESVLDRFEAEIGRDITQQGEQTLEARFRLLQGVLQDKDTLYITGERDVFNDYNAGLRIVFRFR